MAKQQISISFKNNTKETELFGIINKIEDKAGEINAGSVPALAQWVNNLALP